MTRAAPTFPPHAVLGGALTGPWADALESAVFGMGCFWGVERIFWQIDGVVNTHVGYAGGHTQDPTYEQVCTGQTGHAEVVRVVFDPKKVSYNQLLSVFWENHDPTQGMRQGNDVGSQYRSAIFATSDAQLTAAEESAEAFAPRLAAAGYGDITTEIRTAGTFAYAEASHQQYLARNPNGYCGLAGTGVSCPVAWPA